MELVVFSDIFNVSIKPTRISIYVMYIFIRHVTNDKAQTHFSEFSFERLLGSWKNMERFSQ